MTLPPMVGASGFVPRIYKQNIDARTNGVQHNGYHKASPEISEFLSRSKSQKKKVQVAQVTRRREKSHSGKKAPRQASPPRPTVLERRKSSSLTADAETQIREFQALAQSLLELREQEQQDISRELHDNIAQVISAVTNRISLARQERIPAWLRQELEDLREHLKTALDDVRTLARELRPSVLDHRGFAAALDKHAEAFRERTRMTLDIAVVPEAVSFLDHGDLTHLFRLTQEALQNIEDHSGARNAWVNLCQCDGVVKLEIGDDGCSFSPERVVEAQKDGHLGLLGMRERAELLGGKILLDAVPAQGTVITLTLSPPHKTRAASAPEFQI